MWTYTITTDGPNTTYEWNPLIYLVRRRDCFGTDAHGEWCSSCEQVHETGGVCP